VENSTTNMSAGQGQGDPGRPMEQVREQTREMMEKGQEIAGRAVDQARTQITSQLSTQKDQLAGSIDGIAHALRTTGSQLHDNNQANLTPLVDRAADMIEGFSGYLREHDLEDLVVDVESMARRNPGVFLGATFALGFVMARFLKSSSDRAYQTSNAGYYDGGRSLHPEEVHRGYEESRYRREREERRLRSSSDRAMGGEVGWATGSTASSPAANATRYMGGDSELTGQYLDQDADEADESVTYSGKAQE